MHTESPKRTYICIYVCVCVTITNVCFEKNNSDINNIIFSVNVLKTNSRYNYIVQY